MYTCLNSTVLFKVLYYIIYTEYQAKEKQQDLLVVYRLITKIIII